jgi:4-oxalocrotonate tautomerase
MPAIKLFLSGERADYDVVSIIENLTEMTCRILIKEKSKTMIIVEFIQRDLWFIGSNSLDSLGKNSFKIDVTVTDETCTKDQKASYIKEGFILLNRYVNQLHEHSNIHVIDCRGGAYGYGGKTQDYLYYHN